MSHMVMQGSMPVGAEFATQYQVPKKGERVISRQRLLRMLDENTGKRVQTLCAPAGYGKTTLLIEFANNLEVPVCWYQLNSSDQDPRQLLEGILSAIKAHFPDFGSLTQSRLQTTADVKKDLMQLAGLIAGEMYSKINDYLVLVIEDYNAIEGSETAGALLNMLIEKLPENCHLVISSRTQIGLPALDKMAAYGQAAQICSEDLAFTAPEVKELNALHNIDLSDEETAEVTEKCKGWIVGILLSTRVFGPNVLSPSFHTSQRTLHRYLLSEILDKQPPDYRSFLLASSVLEDMVPEYCERLMPHTNCQELLEELSINNLFTSCVDHKKAIFRYHGLFREFLQKQLHQEDPDGFLNLHSQAACMFEELRRWQEAINHFSIARRYSEVIRVVKLAGPDFIKAGKWTTVAQWIKTLPESIRSNDPEITLLYAQSLIYLGDAAESLRLISTLLPRIDKKPLLKSNALSWRGAAFRITGHLNKAVQDIRAAILQMESNNGPPDVLGDAYRRLGGIYADQGRFKLALRNMRLALEQFSTIFDIAQMAEVNNWLGVLYKRKGDLRKAGVYFEDARIQWMKTGNDSSLAMTLNNVAYIYQRLGQHEMALETLNSALDTVRRTGYPRVESLLLIAKAEVLRDINRYPESLACSERGLAIARDVMEPYYVIWAKAGMAETDRLLGAFDRAESLLIESIFQAREKGYGYETTLFEMQLGIVRYESGDSASGREMLSLASRRLTSLGDKDALAKAYFHLAQLEFLDRNYDEAIGYLTKSCRLADELGYDDFLAVEGKRAKLLLELAIARGLESKRLARIVGTIDKRRTDAMSLTAANEDVKPERPDIIARALGDTEVTIGSRSVTDADWKSQRAKELFFYLISNDAGKTKEEITADIWPEMPATKATSNLHINLFRARQAVHPRAFVMEGTRYRLNPHIKVWLDVSEFEEQLRLVQGATGGGPQLNSDLEHAVGLYRGPFLKDSYSEWVETRRRELERKYLKALFTLAQEESKCGRHDKAVALLEKFISIDPFFDDAYCELIEEYLFLGDEVSASIVYKRYTENITRELNCPPSARASDLHTRLISHIHKN